MRGALLVALLLQPISAWSLGFSECVTDLRHEAAALGVAPRTLDSALTGVLPDDRVIRLDRHQPERVLTLRAYLQRLLSDARVQRGKQELRRLDARGAHYPVQSALLVALWGIETDYGRITGEFDTVRSLTTLACDARRPAFFRRELLALLQLIESGQFGDERPSGSWAGALGYLQFLPSVLQRHGRDLDGDGRVSIFAGNDELFTTAARFLADSGWRQDQTWGVELALPVAGCAGPAECRYTDMAQWRGLGWRDRQGQGLPTAAGPARVIHFDESPPRAFVVFSNFEALLKWNRSTKYAIAVGRLHDALTDQR